MAIAAAPDVAGFRALTPLGYGPTSTLYSAQSQDLGRWVALTIYDSSLTDPASKRSFQCGYETARRLGTHPNAVTVLDSRITADGRPAVASEIYEHGALQSRLEGRTPLSVEEVLQIGVGLAGVLETAHRANIVHGALHPSRVFFGADRQPALADFGLVPLVDHDGRAALVGPLAHHAAPEVLEGETATPLADIYSLASILHTALAGQPPYGDEISAALLLRILQHDAAPLERPDVPPALEKVLYSGLSPYPDHRPSGAMALVQALQSAQHELGLSVSEPVLLDIGASLTVVPPIEESAQRVFVPYQPAPSAPSASPATQDVIDLRERPAEPVHTGPPRPRTKRPPAPEEAGGLRALPVIVLAVVVAIIFVGVFWSIVAGDEHDNAASQTGETGPGETRALSGNSGVTAAESAAGVQLDWDNEAEGQQLVVLLSTTQPAQALPAESGTALLIPADALAPDSGYCFAVVSAGDPVPSPGEIAAELPDDALSPQGCIRGASPETVQRK